MVRQDLCSEAECGSNGIEEVERFFLFSHRGTGFTEEYKFLCFLNSSLCLRAPVRDKLSSLMPCARHPLGGISCV